MPEDPNKFDALSRIIFRQRLKAWAIALAILLPFAALLGIFVLPDQEVGAPEEARVISTAMEASDGPARRLINIELNDGTRAVLSARPLIAPSPGDMLCVTRVRQPVVGRISFRPARPGACEGL
ncbi:MAG: hypothetical protein AAFX59_04905 [Pseudomonadota bacterium]